MRGVRGGRMAMIFQEPQTSLNPVLTVGDQIGEAVRVHEGRPRDGIQDRILELPAVGRHPGPGPAADRVSPPALRRHEAAGDDRHGARRGPGAPDRGRAHHGARCHHPGPGAAAAQGPPGLHGPRSAAHHPRPGGGGGDRGPTRRHVCGPDRGDRRGGRLLRGSCPSLQPPADGEPALRGQTQRAARLHPRTGPAPGPTLPGLPVRRPLRARAVPLRHPGARLGGPGARTWGPLSPLERRGRPDPGRGGRRARGVPARADRGRPDCAGSARTCCGWTGFRCTSRSSAGCCGG